MKVPQVTVADCALAISQSARRLLFVRVWRLRNVCFDRSIFECWLVDCGAFIYNKGDMKFERKGDGIGLCEDQLLLFSVLLALVLMG